MAGCGSKKMAKGGMVKKGKGGMMCSPRKAMAMGEKASGAKKGVKKFAAGGLAQVATGAKALTSGPKLRGPAVRTEPAPPAKPGPGISGMNPVYSGKPGPGISGMNPVYSGKPGPGGPTVGTRSVPPTVGVRPRPDQPAAPLPPGRGAPQVTTIGGGPARPQTDTRKPIGTPKFVVDRIKADMAREQAGIAGQRAAFLNDASRKSPFTGNLPPSAPRFAKGGMVKKGKK